MGQGWSTPVSWKMRRAMRVGERRMRGLREHATAALEITRREMRLQ